MRLSLAVLTVNPNPSSTIYTLSQASITVWRRYGSMGDILVRGSGTVAPSNSIPANQVAATAADFVITPPPTVIPDGVTMATINISLPDNAVSSSLKVFLFTLTTVERVPPTTGTKLFHFGFHVQNKTETASATT